MKRFLLWLVGVVLGVGIFLGAVMEIEKKWTMPITNWGLIMN